MTVIKLLKSWAIPPASRPTASIFCAWRSCSSLCRSASSARLRSVTSSTAVCVAGAPSQRMDDSWISVHIGVPSRFSAWHSYRDGADSPRVLAAASLSIRASSCGAIQRRASRPITSRGLS
jgi:hypothetical protein